MGPSAKDVLFSIAIRRQEQQTDRRNRLRQILRRPGGLARRRHRRGSGTQLLSRPEFQWLDRRPRLRRKVLLPGTDLQSDRRAHTRQGTTELNEKEPPWKRQTMTALRTGAFPS